MFRKFAVGVLLLVGACATPYRAPPAGTPTATFEYVHPEPTPGMFVHMWLLDDLRCTRPKFLKGHMSDEVGVESYALRSGERIYLLVRNSDYGPYNASSHCENVISFVPETGKRYRASQKHNSRQTRCRTEVWEDGSGKAPDSLRYEKLEVSMCM